MTSSYRDLPVAVRDALSTLTTRLFSTFSAEERTDFAKVERDLIATMADLGRTVLREKLASLDPAGADVLVDGRRHWQTVRASHEYMSPFGTISVERGLYREVRNGPTVCPMELRAGVVEGFWTAHAAKVAALAVSDMTSYRAESFFAELGMMKASRSSFERLPKGLHKKWEAKREDYEARVRLADAIPAEAAFVAVSLDGVMVPMRGKRKAKMKARARSRGRAPKGPAGYREVSCGAIIFYNAKGKRVATRRIARMPESDMATLKEHLRLELAHALEVRPDLVTVALADGAHHNWAFFETLSCRHQIVDFYHAVQHLKRALDVSMGATHLKTQKKFKKLRTLLLTRRGGVDMVIRSLQQLRPKLRGGARDWLTGVNYFKRHRTRMNYATFRAKKLPIGSGVIESTCKSLASDRLKRAGMRWKTLGGQAILTLRAWMQSDRLDAAWTVLNENYIADVVPMRSAA